MSFLVEASSRRAATVARTLAASSLSAAPRATFTTTVELNKTIAESAKDTLKKVDRTVSDKLVDGINIGSTVAGKAKEAASDATSGKVKGQAAELRGEASGKASEIGGKAKGTASELAGKAKGAAEEAQRKL